SQLYRAGGVETFSVEIQRQSVVGDLDYTGRAIGSEFDCIAVENTVVQVEMSNLARTRDDSAHPVAAVGPGAAVAFVPGARRCGLRVKTRQQRAGGGEENCSAFGSIGSHASPNTVQSIRP